MTNKLTITYSLLNKDLKLVRTYSLLNKDLKLVRTLTANKVVVVHN